MQGNPAKLWWDVSAGKGWRGGQIGKAKESCLAVAIIMLNEMTSQGEQLTVALPLSSGAPGTTGAAPEERHWPGRTC